MKRNDNLAEQSRAEQSRAEQSRAEQSRAEQSRAALLIFSTLLTIDATLKMAMYTYGNPTRCGLCPAFGGIFCV